MERGREGGRRREGGWRGRVGEGQTNPDSMVAVSKGVVLHSDLTNNVLNLLIKVIMSVECDDR